MPKADIPVYQNQMAKIRSLDGLCVREDVLFANHKGEEKPRIRKRSEKGLEKLRPALLRVLLPDESVFLIARAQSPLNLFEQVTAGWWTAILAACAVVMTNKRILFFPVKTNGTWKESVRAAQWGDLAEIKPKTFLIAQVTFKFKNGRKQTYSRFVSADAKRIAAIATILLPAGAGEHSAAQGMVQLCPDCKNVLTSGVYACSGCGLTFKNEKSMILRSVFLPGGGYFYTGHPWIGLLPAIAEVILILEIFLIVFTGSRRPEKATELVGVFLMLAIVWAFETVITILHCRRYVREFIPEKRDPARSIQLQAVGIGR